MINGGEYGVVGREKLRCGSRRRVGTFRRTHLYRALRCLTARSPFCGEVFTRGQVSMSRIHALRSLRRVPAAAGRSLRSCGSSFLYISEISIISCIAASKALNRPIAFTLARGSLRHLTCGRRDSFVVTNYAGRSIVRLVAAVSHQFVTNLTCFVNTERLNYNIIQMKGNVPRLR